MKQPVKGQLMRFYIGEKQSHGALPIYEDIFFRARGMNMAGATIVKGGLGFGASELLGDRQYRVSGEEAVIVEIVDTPEKIAAFHDAIKGVIGDHGLITIQDLTIMHYGRKNQEPG